MNNILLNTNIHECTGCGMCAAVCPVSAITMELSEKGFYVPIVNTSNCIECGKCIKTCYKFDENNNRTDISKASNIVCYGAQNLNEDELKNGSSGATSIELMRECIHQGYKVVGVAYDKIRENAVTRIVDSEDDLDQFRGSKYFQSFTEDAFKIICRDKSNTKYAIFGTPCQIYAFSKYAQRTNQQDRFLLIDIFCHGCPSMNLWKKYLYLKKNECCVDEFDDIKFRSKSHNWHEFCFDFIKNNKHFLSSKYSDPFYELFFSMDVFNEACYDCVARSSIAEPDIRLGDFWGIRYDMDKKGVSAVVLCTDRGRRLFNSVKDNFKCTEVTFEEVIAAQSFGKEHRIHPERRAKTLALLRTSSLEQTVREHRKLIPRGQNLKAFAKQLLKHLPFDWYLRLKRLTHKIRN